MTHAPDTATITTKNMIGMKTKVNHKRIWQEKKGKIKIKEQTRANAEL